MLSFNRNFVTEHWTTKGLIRSVPVAAYNLTCHNLHLSIARTFRYLFARRSPVQLQAKILVEASPEAVFTFFEQIQDNFRTWHPDHITFRWVKGDRLDAGNEAYFAEEIAGDVNKWTIRYVVVEPPKCIEFHPTSRIIRFFVPHIRFRIEPVDGGCRVTQQVKVRTGPIGRRLNSAEFDAIQNHMTEEGENLKEIVESGA